MGTLFLVAWLKCAYLGNWDAISLFFPVALAIFLAVNTILIDIKHFIIPDILTIPSIIAGMALSFAFPESWTMLLRISQNFGFSFDNLNIRFAAITFSALSAILAYVAFAIFAIAGRRVFKVEALGWGDVKYMTAIAAILGFPGAFFTALFGSLVGSAYGLSLVAFGKAGLKTPIPFGPFLGFGTLVWIFLDNRIISAYIALSKFLASKIQIF